MLFSSICYILTVSIAFYVYKKTVRLNELKTGGAMIAKILVFVICVEAILYNLHDCTFRTERKKLILDILMLTCVNFDILSP